MLFLQIFESKGITCSNCIFLKNWMILSGYGFYRGLHWSSRTNVWLFEQQPHYKGGSTCLSIYLILCWTWRLFGSLPWIFFFNNLGFGSKSTSGIFPFLQEQCTLIAFWKSPVCPKKREVGPLNKCISISAKIRPKISAKIINCQPDGKICPNFHIILIFYEHE